MAEYDQSCNQAARSELIPRTGDDAKYRRAYYIRVPPQHADVAEDFIRDWAARIAPTIPGWRASSYDYDEFNELLNEYRVEIQYEEDIATPVPSEPPPPPPDAPETGDWRYAFNFVAAGYHAQLVPSSDWIGTFPVDNAAQRPDPAAIDWRGIVNAEMKDEGVWDINGWDVEPSPETHTISFYPSISTVTQQYRNDVLELMGSVNQQPFDGHEIGEVQLVRAQGQLRSNDDWQLDFGYAFKKKPAENLVFCQGHPRQITIPFGVVEPHGFIWFQYSPYVSAAKKARIKMPIAAHHIRAWPFGDFSKLQIPGTVVP